MEAVRVLLRQNAAPNMQDNNGQTALFLATNATNEYLDIVQALLKNGAQPGIKNKSGKTALQTAVERDHANIVRLLLNTGRLSNTDRTDAFILAAVGAHRDSIAVFLDNGFDPNTTDGSGYTVLMRVAMQDNDNVGSAVKILVSAGADIHAKDSRGYTALAQAANVGSVRGVKALVENGASATDIEGRKAFWASVDGGRQYVVSLFMDYGANANLLDDSNGMTLLMVAAEKGHEGTTRALIKGGANINAQNRYGNTPLILAAEKGRRNVVKLLLLSNADVSITNKDGKTALMLAQENKHGDTIKELSRVQPAQ